MSEKSGPFVQTACFCENIIEDKTGVFSLIRIIDTLNVTSRDTEPPDDMPSVRARLTMALMFKSGKARGRFDLRVDLEDPSGVSNNVIEMSVHFEGEEKGHTVINPIDVEFAMEGLHWFNVYLEDDLVTAIPFKIRYSRIRLETG